MDAKRMKRGADGRGGASASPSAGPPVDEAAGSARAETAKGNEDTEARRVDVSGSGADVDVVPGAGVGDLPDPLLGCISRYLVPPSQAMFAVALRAPSSSWCSRRRKSIFSESMRSDWLCESRRWDILDFEDIDGDLAGKLGDDDLGAILISVDAKNSLERLKLAGLVNVSGKGLEFLSRSTKLKQIDLSLVGQHDVFRPPGVFQMQLSEAIVVPIIRSIVIRDGCSLRQMQLPRKWCGYRNRSADMNLLLQEYSSLLDDRPFACEGGTHQFGECFGTDREDWFTAYAFQRFTCHKCLNNFCNDPALDVRINVCTRCQKSYCQECCSVYHNNCQGCREL